MAGYQLKITIEYTKPPVWRRVIVPDGITFEDLHKVIQEAFGWENMHLHDFSFPNDWESRIGPEEGMDNFFSDDLDETQVYLDEYIKDHSWIRYTYDFGDEWRHKIILEKELPDYKERYSQIIKYRGNNFAEDSGGIWEGEIVSDIFDIETVNDRLKQLIFHQKKVGKRKKKEKNQLSALKKELFNDTISEKFFMTMDNIVKQRKDQLDDTTVKLWERTLEDFKTLINIGSGMMMNKRLSLLETKMDQIGLYYEENENSFIGARIKIKKAISKRNQREILMDFQKDELQNSMESLKIYFAKSWNKERLTEKLAENLQEHGEYLYYLLNKQEFSDFLKFFHAPKGIYKGKISAITLKNLVWWGYIDIQYSERENSITIVIPKETEELFEKLEKTNWRKECGDIEKTSEEMFRLMQYYGYIEVEKFYLKYTQALRQINKEDFYKYIYFAVDGHDFSWVVSYKGEDYLYLKDLDMKMIMDCREELVQDLDYPTLTRLDVERWKKGLGTVYPDWMEFAQYLYSSYGLSQENLEEVIGMELYSCLLEGSSLEELVEVLEDWISIEDVEDWVEVWKHLQKIFLHTRIAALKGYTREELAEKQGVNPFTIAVNLEEDSEGKTIKTSTHLYKTPLEYQNKVSEILSKSQDFPREAAKDLEELMMKYNRQHYESRILLAEIYYMSGQPNKAQRELKEVLKNNQRNRNLEETLLLEEEEIRKAKPFQRKEKKIGRNDLCPCGSGKKYKFCCGKNK